MTVRYCKKIVAEITKGLENPIPIIFPDSRDQNKPIKTLEKLLALRSPRGQYHFVSVLLMNCYIAGINIGQTSRNFTDSLTQLHDRLLSNAEDRLYIHAYLIQLVIKLKSILHKEICAEIQKFVEIWNKQDRTDYRY
jgi:hypothetical protein